MNTALKFLFVMAATYFEFAHSSGHLNQTRSKATASLFDAPRCRSILNTETMSWKKLCGSSDAQADPMCGGQRQKVANGTTSSNTTVVYVRNQKAASQMWCSSLNKLLDLNYRKRQRCLLGDQWLKPSRNRVFFSFVRDPLDAAISGYMEVALIIENHVPPKCRKKSKGGQFMCFGGQDLALVQSAFGAQSRSLGTNNCIDAADATGRLIHYLRLLESRSEMVAGIHHSFPQAVKLDHVGPRYGEGNRYDFLGNIKFLEEDTNEIRKHLGATGPFNLQVLNAHRHSHKDQSCASLINRNNPELLNLVCRLYEVDYTCLGYPIPPSCIKQQKQAVGS